MIFAGKNNTIDRVDRSNNKIGHAKSVVKKKYLIINSNV